MRLCVAISIVAIAQRAWSIDPESTTCSMWSIDVVPDQMHHRHSTASAVTTRGSYMFAGYDMTGQSQTLDDLWLRSPQDGTWSQPTASASAIPKARYSHSLSSNQAGELMLYGGTGATNSVLSDGWLFDPSEDTWRAMSTPTSPGPLTGHTAIHYGDRMLVFGGNNGSDEQNDLWMLSADSGNMTSAAWSRIAPVGPWPSPRQQHSATLVQVPGQSDVMIVYGGCEGEACRDVCTAAALGDVWSLDLESMAWSQVYSSSDAGGPSPRFGHSAITFGDGQLGFAAGSTCQANSSSMAEQQNGDAVQLWFYQLSSKSWQLSTNSQCLGPVSSGLLRPFFQLSSTAPLTSMFFGNDQVFERVDDGTVPVGWSIDLQPDQCKPQCSGRGVCQQGSETKEFLQCECYPFSDTDGTTCGNNSYNFQWYLLYSAFGVTVLLVCFFLRRVYGCMRRRHQRSDWAAQGFLDRSAGPLGAMQPPLTQHRRA
eukprot:TRINITY_DN481_c0_g1_i2.p1 TRINITY_DN481_c0_g1~~TRINITY_DN481_c0_g1_i2.p1  ORF type:complete len:481 (+),score=102.22 TRINITY_DN481_c0_g1_i2:172-1614(+)